ncbi:MAG: ATP-binding protein [Candidatus Aceula meridiana]|nr:ATP-binding protein [Candidatus Aceula meridiana]
MKTSSKKITDSKRKLQSLKKSKKKSSASGQKKAKKPILEKKSGNEDRQHCSRRVSDKDKTHNDLTTMVSHQADELKIKNGQIKAWIDKEKLSEEQVYIRTKVMDSVSDGIFIIDAQKTDFPIIYSNQAFHMMIGMPKKDIVGQNYFLLYGAAADPRIAEEIKNTLHQDKSFHGEMLNFRKNGENFWNYLRIAPVRDANGIVTHYAGIQTDVTSMRQKDLEIKEQREDLLHVTRVGKLAEFVSSLAHEISQPLTAILSYTQAAQRMFAGREPQLQEILQYIVNDDQRASEVIRRLRSLLKKSDPEFKPLDMNAIVNETVVLITTDVTVRNKVVKVELAKKLPLIRGDRIQLQQVLLNLISNSLDAMESRDESRQLMIRTSRKNSNTIMVELEDSGCGIPVENMKKLFKHFFTSKLDGLGMGLSISRSIVEAHGGRLEAKNNPDRGATFYFTIPVISAKSTGIKDAL